jgi:hypothetical protein
LPEPAVTIAPPKAANAQPRTRPPTPTPATHAPAGIPPPVGRLALEPAGGQPLPPVVAASARRSFGHDFSAVRVHTGVAAAAKARAVGARAFTVGRSIFLGARERATDDGLIAHELAHVVQQGGAAVLQRWTARGGDRYEQEAQRASSAAVQGATFTVRERTPTMVQRLGISDALDYFADKANLIPGYRMFTIVLGVNPVNMSRVERSAANIMRAIVEFIPGGGLVTQALDNYGVFERVGGWVEQQIRTLGVSGGAIRDAINRFLGSLSWTDIFDLGGVWERAKRIFSEPIDRIISFASGLITGILGFIKDAILRPLAAMAEGTAGYDLLKAVIGRDPITGDAVPRTAETLIGPFMRLIGQEEVWENIKRGNAVARAWAWFQGALSGLLGFVTRLPSLFIAALRSLTIEDIVLLSRAFGKLIAVFGDFAGRFFSWAGQQVMRLLEIIFEVVAPGVMPYIRKAMGAFRTIIANPVAFIGNLVRAGVQGFRQFASGFLGHLRRSLIGWLTGSLSGAGIYIPQAFDLREIIKFVLSVLGVTWQNIRGKLVRVVGETAVGAMEQGFDLVVTLVRDGPAAAWEKIRESLGNLRDMVMGQVMTFVKTRIVEAAITRLVTSLNPAGAFIQAVIAIYNTIIFVVERLRQIGQVVASFIDSISAIAAGAVGAAANRVEQTMGGLLTLVISFLARLVGLGNVSQVILNIVRRIRAPIDRAIDRVVAWIVATARSLGRFVAQTGVPQDPATRLRLAAQAAVAVSRRLSGRVTQSLLTPLLRGISVRYGLRRIEAFERAGMWWVRASINPEREESLGVPTAATGPAVAGPATDRPLDERAAGTIKAEALTMVRSRLMARRPPTIDQMAALVREVATELRPRGLQRLVMRVANSETLALQLQAEASAAQRADIRWDEVFVADPLTQTQLDDLKPLFVVAGFETYAAVSINGRLVGSRSNAAGHAEQEVIGSIWPSALQQADALAKSTSQRVRLALAINRSPCHSICTPALITAIGGAKGWIDPRVDFVLAATGAYAPSRAMTPAEIQAETQNIQALLSLPLAAAMKMVPKTAWVLAGTPNAPDPTTTMDIGRLQGAGWDVRAMQTRSQPTGAQREWLQAVTRLKARITSLVSQKMGV